MNGIFTKVLLSFPVPFHRSLGLLRSCHIPKKMDSVPERELFFTFLNMYVSYFILCTHTPEYKHDISYFKTIIQEISIQNVPCNSDILQVYSKEVLESFQLFRIWSDHLVDVCNVMKRRDGSDERSPARQKSGPQTKKNFARLKGILS